MKFQKMSIVQADSWLNTIDAVNNQAPPGKWIFRAVEAPKDDAIFIDRSGKFTEVTISVRSSFDRAWDSRLSDSNSERWKYEAWMLREFKRAAYHYRSNLPASNHHLEWLALGRHYEMPARLVDFTYTFYVASYFAVSGKGKKKHAFILALDLEKLKKKTEEKLHSWNLSPRKADWDFHNPVIFRKFAFVKKPLWVAPLAPFKKNERLLNQRGLFLCPGSIKNTFEENLNKTLASGVDYKLICLKSDIRTDVIKDLRNMNVDMRTLYPDLIGFSQSIRDLVHIEIDSNDARFEKELKRAISAAPWG